ncbi:copper resistance protein NlpE N-terminal domain-containing protein [bacterium]|nr:copper resistance protein NlpE N-terminal domain-containing protein [bacterium]
MKKLFTLAAVIFAIMAVFAEEESMNPVGAYAAKLPSADGMGRIIIIHLFSNGNAMRTNVYIGKPSGDYVEQGKWEIKDNIITVAVEKERKGPAVIGSKLKFRLEKDGLVPIQYDETPFGEKLTIKFVKLSEVTPPKK